MREGEWRRYVAPTAFLLLATIAIMLVRSGLEAGRTTAVTTAPATTVQRRHRVTTTARTTTHPKKVTTTTPTTTANAPPRRFWTVQAGDSFGVISSKTGVSVATLEQLNPNVSSTSLFIGEKIRTQ